MKIQALKPFTIQVDGQLTSVAMGAVVDLADGQDYIDAGLAQEYTLITPTGTLNITANDTYDVTDYASAVVNVPAPTIQYREFYVTITNDLTNPIVSLQDVLLPTVAGDGLSGEYFQGEAVKVSPYYSRTKLKLPIIDGACRIYFVEKYSDTAGQEVYDIKFTLDQTSTGCSLIAMDGAECCLVVSEDNAEVKLNVEKCL